MSGSPRSTYLAVAVGVVALAWLAWQGHHLARYLPQVESAIEQLGPRGPLVYCAALLVLEPLLVPDTLFGLAAGAAFGLAAGAAYYFAAVYVMCLAVQWLGRHWLKARVLRLLEARPGLRAAVLDAPERGARFTFLVRLAPINQALLSYALGAADVPLRSAVVGNLGMFTHMLPTVYFGAAAVHVTRMAASRHEAWEIRGVLLMLGLAASVAVAVQIARRAWAALEAQAGAGPARASLPAS